MCVWHLQDSSRLSGESTCRHHQLGNIWCMRILNIPTDALYLFSASWELRVVSYGLKTASNAICVLARQLFWLLFTDSWCGTYCQATPGLMNACVNGLRRVLIITQLWVSTTLTIVFSVYLALKTNLVQRKTLKPLESLQCDRKHPFSEVSITVTEMWLAIILTQILFAKSLEASCDTTSFQCVWLKFECVFKTRAFPALMLSPALTFISSTKRIRLQGLQCSSWAQNMLVASNKHVRLQCDIVFVGE